jgi:hypothetical protein
MAATNDRYYATRDPLGTAGDFTTAPEIHQMFGNWLEPRWPMFGRGQGNRPTPSMLNSARGAEHWPVMR